MTTAAFTPVTFTKGGATEIAYSPEDYYQYVWEGWHAGGPPPAVPRSQLAAHLSDLDTVEAKIPNPATFARADSAPVSVKDPTYGAKGDGVTSDSAAITAALAVNGDVVLPAGTYIVSSTIAIPDNTRLRGRGRSRTILKAAPGFAGPLIDLGKFASRLESLAVDCNHVAASVGVRINQAQEMSGLFEVIVSNFVSKGVWVTTGGALTPQNYSVDDCEIYASAQGTAATIGLHVGAGTTAPRILSRLTFNVQALTTLPVGSSAVTVECGAVPMRDLHIEHFNIGISAGLAAGGSATGLSARNVTMSPGVTRGVVLSPGTTAANLQDIVNTSAGHTSTIEDGFGGIILNADRYPVAVFSGGVASTRGISVTASGSEGGVSQLANLSVNGYLRLPAGTTLPTANGQARGRLFQLQPGAGVADGVYICQKDASDVYSWQLVK